MSMSRLSFLSAIAFAAALSCGSLAHAGGSPPLVAGNSIGINFAGGQFDEGTAYNSGNNVLLSSNVTGVAGVVAQPNWNNVIGAASAGNNPTGAIGVGPATGGVPDGGTYTYADSSTSTQLATPQSNFNYTANTLVQNVGGLASPLPTTTISWSNPNGLLITGSTGTADADAPTPTQNDLLMNNNLYTIGPINPNTNITITGIPSNYTTYDLIIYAARQPPSTGTGDLSSYQVNGGSIDEYQLTGTLPFVRATIVPPSFIGYTAGNYIEYTGLTGSTLSLNVGIPGFSGNDFTSVVNGLQIVQLVPVPEPASLSLAAVGLGLAAAAGLARKLRSRRA